jgi:hypothetical protein
MKLFRYCKLAMAVAMMVALMEGTGCATQAPATGKVKSIEIVMVDSDSFVIEGTPVKLADLPSRLISRGVGSDGWINIELPAAGMPPAALSATARVLKQNGFAGMMFKTPKKIKVETKR